MQIIPGALLLSLDKCRDGSQVRTLPVVDAECIDARDVGDSAQCL